MGGHMAMSQHLSRAHFTRLNIVLTHVMACCHFPVGLLVMLTLRSSYVKGRMDRVIWKGYMV
jgi:hypothetical protein